MKLNVKVYSDGADLETMKAVRAAGGIDGFTTNPSLMKKAGVTDYKAFAKAVVEAIPDQPVSFEVFGDDFETMEKEADILASYGDNVFVKIPVTNTKGESSADLIRRLSARGVKLNVTAILTLDQVKEVVDAVSEKSETIVSVFAGRIADTGVDPLPLMKEAAEICHSKKNVYLLWASPREVLNIVQADEVGADIITCTPAITAKRSNLGKDLKQFSLETVQMFNNDVKDLGYSIL